MVFSIILHLAWCQTDVTIRETQVRLMNIKRKNEAQRCSKILA